jgi:exosortase D (VPLPA-CTERM-specific)|tara:strand:- start:123 stop:1697 length:1575 start_codon:yes stop_codon:yes gene_type:complete
MNGVNANYWKAPVQTWLIVLTALAAGTVIFYDGISLMVSWWSNREEYSHGFLIPLITIYLVWQRSDQLRKIQFEGSWLGVLTVILGLFLFFLGELSTIYTVVQYGFVAVIYGVVWAAIGTRAFKVVAVPLLLLFFMIPFPSFIYNNLSSQLQLISSEIGVLVIRLFGISVFLEGNVIDLGTYKLQVVEACNGLRYLFPLMTLGLIVAYLYHAELWKRAIVFFSTIPITILMNSFRIGVIGVMVEYWGQSMAEGFLHDFEGWVIFMACFGILFLEMWLLMRLTKDKRPLNEVFGIDPPEPVDENAEWHTRPLPITMIVATVLIVGALVPATAIPNRVESTPERETFGSFPLSFDGWSGRSETLEQIYLDALKLTDYALINYTNDTGNVVNFYTAYYESQRKGQSAHSPRSCIPGGGWRIESLTQVPVSEGAPGGGDLEVNRVLISNGNHKQLVYYWFQQRGRIITNEYLVKWFVFWDALTKNRTDGALIRLTIPIAPGKDVDELEKTLQRFARDIRDTLPAYVPG